MIFNKNQSHLVKNMKKSAILTGKSFTDAQKQRIMDT